MEQPLFNSDVDLVMRIHKLGNLPRQVKSKESGIIIDIKTGLPLNLRPDEQLSVKSPYRYAVTTVDHHSLMSACVKELGAEYFEAGELVHRVSEEGNYFETKVVLYKNME